MALRPFFARSKSRNKRPIGWARLSAPRRALAARRVASFVNQQPASAIDGKKKRGERAHTTEPPPAPTLVCVSVRPSVCRRLVVVVLQSGAAVATDFSQQRQPVARRSARARARARPTSEFGLANKPTVRLAAPAHSAPHNERRRLTRVAARCGRRGTRPEAGRTSRANGVGAAGPPPPPPP